MKLSNAINRFLNCKKILKRIKKILKKNISGDVNKILDENHNNLENQ